MVNKLFFCSAVLSLACFVTSAHAAEMESVTGTIVETGDLITIQLTQEPKALLAFKADIPKYEMTTGLMFAGNIINGQTVRLVFSGEPEEGFVKGDYLLFNPDNPAAADIYTQLRAADSGVFISDNGKYLLYADDTTDITDSQGRKADLRLGQYILGWFRETIFNESAVLSKAVILNLYDDAPSRRQIRITDSGDVLLDDGPIAKLDETQTGLCRQYHMAPIRPIAEALGYIVEWGPGKTVRITNTEYSFVFNFYDDYYRVNDIFVYLSGKRFIILNDQTFADYSVINTLVNKSGPLNIIRRAILY